MSTEYRAEGYEGEKRPTSPPPRYDDGQPYPGGYPPPTHSQQPQANYPHPGYPHQGYPPPPGFHNQHPVDYQHPSHPYPHPGGYPSTTNNVTVVSAPPTIINNAPAAAASPIIVNNVIGNGGNGGGGASCPNCGTSSLVTIQSESTCMTHICCCLLLPFSCCCLPYCCNWFKESVYRCNKCGTKL